MIYVVLFDSPGVVGRRLGPFEYVGLEPRLVGAGVRMFDQDGREVARLRADVKPIGWRVVSGRPPTPTGRAWAHVNVVGSP